MIKLNTETQNGLSQESFKDFNRSMQEFYDALETRLEKFVGGLSEEEIKTRCKRVSHLGSLNIERWYLDDQLLFETEITYADDVYKWEIRNPK